MTGKDFTDILMYVIGLFVVYVLIQHCSRVGQPIETKTFVHDTICRVDTFYYPMPSKFVVLPVHDTIIDVIYKTDTIKTQVPVVSKVYEDSTYKCQISGGYFANLDYIQVFQRKEYIHTTEKETINRKPILSVVGGIGLNYDIAGRKIVPTIGVTFGVPIFNIYGKK